MQRNAMFRFLRILQTAALMGALFVARAPAVDAADTAPPDPVEDLRAATSTDATITLAWTAPGRSQAASGKPVCPS